MTPAIRTLADERLRLLREASELATGQYRGLFDKQRQELLDQARECGRKIQRMVREQKCCP